jgi:hypothetical protein
MTLDKFVLQFLIQNEDAVKKAKEIEDSLDSLEKKSKSTSKTLSEAFNVSASSSLTSPANKSSRLKRTELDKTISKSDLIPKLTTEINKKKGLQEKEVKETDKKNKETEQTSKNFKELNKSLKESMKSDGIVGFLKSPLFKRLGLIGLGIGAAGTLAGTAISQAKQYNPLFYDQDRLNTSAGNIVGLSRALNLTGTPGDQIVGALGLISRSQTMTRLMGTSPLNNVLNMLNVPLATSQGKARKPEDILLNISGAIEKAIKAGRLKTQDAYNYLELAGFSPGVANFLMQGPKSIRKTMGDQSVSLNQQQIESLHNLNTATQNLENQFSNLKLQISTSLAPALTTFINYLAKIPSGLDYLVDKGESKGIELKKYFSSNPNNLLGYGNTWPFNSGNSTSNVTNHHNVQNLHVHTQSNDSKGIVNEIFNSMNINKVMQSNTGMF